MYQVGYTVRSHHFHETEAGISQFTELSDAKEKLLFMGGFIGVMEQIGKVIKTPGNRLFRGWSLMIIEYATTRSEQVRCKEIHAIDSLGKELEEGSVIMSRKGLLLPLSYEDSFNQAKINRVLEYANYAMEGRRVQGDLNGLIGSVRYHFRKDESGEVLFSLPNRNERKNI